MSSGSTVGTEGEGPVLGSARSPSESIWIYLLGPRRKEADHSSFWSLEAPVQMLFTPDCWGQNSAGTALASALKKHFGKSLRSESGTLGLFEPWDSLH